VGVRQRANYLNEVGMLNRIPRSGLAFLGSGEQSVAEHIYRMLHVAFVLAHMGDEPADELHLIRLVLFPICRKRAPTIITT
jgi:putative hydrolase of HD superfamily